MVWQFCLLLPPQVLYKSLTTKEIGESIFQRSYYDHIIRGEQDYRDIWQYMDNNPTRWQEDEFYTP